MAPAAAPAATQGSTEPSFLPPAGTRFDVMGIVASFSAAEQRYIKRSLDIGLGRQDAFKLWARDADESGSIRSQYVVYQELKALRGHVPAETSFVALEAFMGKHERADGHSKLLRIVVDDVSEAQPLSRVNR